MRAASHLSITTALRPGAVRPPDVSILPSQSQVYVYRAAPPALLLLTFSRRTANCIRSQLPPLDCRYPPPATAGLCPQQGCAVDLRPISPSRGLSREQLGCVALGVGRTPFVEGIKSIIALKKGVATGQHLSQVAVCVKRCRCCSLVIHHNCQPPQCLPFNFFPGSNSERLREGNSI